MTPIQAEIIAVLGDYNKEHGYPPSIREIAQIVNKGTSTVVYHLGRLVEQGLVSRQRGRARTWRPVRGLSEEVKQ